MYISRDCRTHTQHVRTSTDTCKHTALLTHTQIHRQPTSLSRGSRSSMTNYTHTHTPSALLDIVNYRGNNCISAVSKLNGCMLGGSAAGRSCRSLSVYSALLLVALPVPAMLSGAPLSHTITCNQLPFHRRACTRTHTHTAHAGTHTHIHTDLCSLFQNFIVNFLNCVKM